MARRRPSYLDVSAAAAALPFRPFAALLLSLVAANSAVALTVINIPDADPPALVEGDVVLNVTAGGLVPGPIDVRNGGVINVFPGGYFGGETVVRSAGALNVKGGTLTDVTVFSGGEADVEWGAIETLDVLGGQATIAGNLALRSFIPRAMINSGSLDIRSGNVSELDVLGGLTTLRGGTLGDSLELNAGALEIHGYDFALDGNPIPGLANVGDMAPLVFTPGSLFTGTLADGAPFAIAPELDNPILNIAAGVVKLVRVAPPLLPSSYNVPSVPAPRGVGAGQSMVVQSGGLVDDNFVAGLGSTVQLNGGTISHNFEAAGSQVLVNGGNILTEADIFRGAVVTVAGGSLGDSWEVHDFGVLNVAGGSVGSSGRARGGIVNISAGSVKDGFTAADQSTVTVTGGEVRNLFIVSESATVEIAGGLVGTDFIVRSGGSAYLSAGRIVEAVPQNGGQLVTVGGTIELLRAEQGSIVELRGGTLGDGIANLPGSSLTIFGADFELNGDPLADLAQPGAERVITGASNFQLAGTLEDGTPFAFSGPEGDMLGTVKLVARPVAPGAPLIQVNSAAAPLGVHGGQQLDLLPGGVLPDNFNAGRGSVVNIQGGTIGANFEAYGATVNIDAGNFAGLGFDALRDSVVNIRGGTVAEVEPRIDSTVNVAGGFVGVARATAGSNLNIESGRVNLLTLGAATHVDFSGGTVGNISSLPTGSITLYGADFEIDGTPVAGLDVPGDSTPFSLQNRTLTGVLADGSPLLLSTVGQAQLTLVRSADPPLPPGPQFQVVNSASAPFAVGEGQTLRLESPGQLPNGFVAGAGSVVDIRGGSVGEQFKAFDSEVHISGGLISRNFTALAGADVTITGGSVTFLNAAPGAEVLISGGQVSAGNIQAGSSIEILGTAFLLNDQPIPGFTGPGSSVPLMAQAGQVLKATLADGSQLQWATAGLFPPRGGGFSVNALITLRLVPEPATILLAFVFGAAVISSLEGRGQVRDSRRGR